MDTPINFSLKNYTQQLRSTLSAGSIDAQALRAAVLEPTSPDAQALYDRLAGVARKGCLIQVSA